MIKADKILVLAPHTDDGELGCGASIAKFIEEGREVFYAAFSICRKSLPAGLSPDTLEKECREATQMLGIPSSNLFFFDYDVRTFPEHRQSILDELIQLGKKVAPDMVLFPASTDIHQDHQVIHQEALRAFKHATLLGYELPWNNFNFHHQFFIAVDETAVQKKLAAVRCYQSQSHRSYTHESFLSGLLKVRGVQCGAGYAEGFELYHAVAL